MVALRTAPTCSDSFERPTTVMMSLEDANGDPGNPEARTRSLSRHRGSPAAREQKMTSATVAATPVAAKYAMDLLPSGKCLSKGVGSALVDEFKASKNVPGWREGRINQSPAQETYLLIKHVESTMEFVLSGPIPRSKGEI